MSENKAKIYYKWEDFSPYFTKEEIFSPDTINYLHLVNLPSLIRVNTLRERLGYALTINTEDHQLRGVRSAREVIKLVQTTIGAAMLSEHVQGKAFDVSGRSPKDLKEIQEAAIAVGFTYTKIYPTWVHIDDRNLII